jgi:NADPH2:quinone reductase
LGKGGRLVVPGATSGPRAEVDVRRVFDRQVTIYGSTMGSRDDWDRLVTLAGEGKLHPAIDRTFPLEAAAQAQARLASGEQFGKVVLDISPLT